MDVVADLKIYLLNPDRWMQMAKITPKIAWDVGTIPWRDRILNSRQVFNRLFWGRNLGPLKRTPCEDWLYWARHVVGSCLASIWFKSNNPQTEGSHMVVDFIERVASKPIWTSDQIVYFGVLGVSKNRAHTMILSGLEKPPAVPVVSLWAIWMGVPPPRNPSPLEMPQLQEAMPHTCLTRPTTSHHSCPQRNAFSPFRPSNYWNSPPASQLRIMRLSNDIPWCPHIWVPSCNIDVENPPFVDDSPKETVGFPHLCRFAPSTRQLHGGCGSWLGPDRIFSLKQ